MVAVTMSSSGLSETRNVHTIGKIANATTMRTSKTATASAIAFRPEMVET